MNQVTANMQGAADFLKYQSAFSSIEGFLPDLQAYALLLLARHGPGSGEIVEIGSFLGRSTTFLATGSKLAGREKVHAIDHFKGSKEHQTIEGIENLLDAFRKNIQAAGVEDWVNVHVGDSAAVAAGWDKPIRLLFIDGSHEYAPSRIDYESWSPFVIRGGLICFHDVDSPFCSGEDSVTRYYRELMAQTNDLVEIMEVDSAPMKWGYLKAVQKTK